MRFHFAALIVFSLGCAPSTGGVVVDVITDFAPEIEFFAVHTRVARASGVESRLQEATALRSHDFLAPPPGG